MFYSVSDDIAFFVSIRITGTPEQICVSQYRCLQSNVCLSLDYLCDGTRQCPLGDDERFCDFRY